MEALGFGLRQEAVLGTLTADVLKSSEIQGENSMPSKSALRSLGGSVSISSHLNPWTETPRVVEMMLDAPRRHGEQLTAQRLFGWHAALFAEGAAPTPRAQSAAGRF